MSVGRWKDGQGNSACRCAQKHRLLQHAVLPSRPRIYVPVLALVLNLFVINFTNRPTRKPIMVSVQPINLPALVGPSATAMSEYLKCHLIHLVPGPVVFLQTIKDPAYMKRVGDYPGIRTTQGSRFEFRRSDKWQTTLV
jgi:hypothetical protein